MKLKQAIVCKHEFTYLQDTGKGSRGSSPGEYITKYMSRPEACESYGLPRYDEYDTRDAILYRIQHAERSALTHEDLQSRMQQATGRGGFAFGTDGISLSHEKLNSVSRKFQNLYEKGKTIKKLVISFRTDYLQNMGVIPPDLVCRRDGDFRGNVDLGKLRSAVARGIEQLEPYYDSLYWVATIQEDTQHIHCHACLVDRGRGVLHTDGSQKGVISQRSFQIIRRGINMDLLLSRNLVPRYTKESWISTIKSSTLRRFDLILKVNDGIPPALERMMPEKMSRNWKPDETVRKAMQTVAQEWLDAQDIRMKGPVTIYFDRMEQAETPEQKTDCYSMLMDDCCSVLADHLRMKKNFRTEIARSTPHKPVYAQAHQQKFHYDALLFHAERRNTYEHAAASGTGSADLRAWYESEAEYHQQMIQLHQQEVARQGITSLFRIDLEDLTDMKAELHKLQMLKNDPITSELLKMMSPQGAEKMLMNSYGLPGGAKICAGQLDEYADLKSEQYDRKLKSLKSELARYGFLVRESGGTFFIESISPFSAISRYAKAHELYLPQELKHLSADQKDVFRAAAESRLQSYAGIENELAGLPEAENLIPHDLQSLQNAVQTLKTSEQNGLRFRRDQQTAQSSKEIEEPLYTEEEFDPYSFSTSFQPSELNPEQKEDVEFGF